MRAKNKQKSKEAKELLQGGFSNK